MTRFLLFGSCLVWLALSGCRESSKKDASPRAPAAPPAAREVTLSDERLRFTYADKSGKFVMAQRAFDIPKDSRGAVMLVDLSRTAPEGDHVWVVDLRAEPPMERVTATAMERPAFERLARGYLQANRPPVVMYATTWCGVCRRARGFFKQHGVAYTERDVEKDPGAAAELRDKAAKAGVNARGVPVFDVAGRILAGFDEDALKRALKL